MAVKDYGDTNRTIKIGYAGNGLTKDQLTHIAGYTDSGTKIKDVDRSVLQSWLSLNEMINAQLSTGSDTPQDADYYISQYAGGGTTTTTYHRRPMSALWAYIKSKADSVYQKKGDYSSEITTITKSIQLTTDWQDVGIAGKDLETGTYAVQVSGFNSSYTYLYGEIYSGVMTWFAGDTNNGGRSDEIFLHNAGHAENNNAIYLRTSRTNRGDDGTLHLQIACKVAATGTDTLTFKFRRLI